MRISDEMKYFIEIVGKDNAVKICRVLKKKSIYFSKDKNNFNEELKSIFGNMFDVIHKTFKGITLYFPASLEDEDTYEQIRNDYWKKNMSYMLLAQKYDRTVVNIRKICRIKK
jgi:hypothetical protein